MSDINKISDLEAGTANDSYYGCGEVTLHIVTISEQLVQIKRNACLLACAIFLLANVMVIYASYKFSLSVYVMIGLLIWNFFITQVFFYFIISISTWRNATLKMLLCFKKDKWIKKQLNHIHWSHMFHNKQFTIDTYEH